MSRFDPTPRSLRAHRVPPWFEDAKLGIFVHWTPSCVPAWAPRAGSLPDLLRTQYDSLQALSPYAEWYWNALRLPGSPTARHHAETYGDAPYESFGPLFDAALRDWDPAPWAELFAAAGARYVVLVTKHHDGFCLWPAHPGHPRLPGWQATRDVVGELAGAVRARGLRFGVYYSGGLDWTFESRPIRTVADGLAAVPLDPAYERYVDAHYRDLVARYRPSVLWNDIAYPPHHGALWRLLSDYYAAVPEGVVNDRFGPAPAGVVRALRIRPLRAAADAWVRRAVAKPDFQMVPPRPPVYDFRTPEYARFPDARPGKWEATRGIGHGFGANRNEDERNRIDPDVLVRDFVDIVSKNGNLLLNVGPTLDGGIHPSERLRLDALGAWLRVHGAAIYGTRPWRQAEGITSDGIPVRFTKRGPAAGRAAPLPAAGAEASAPDGLRAPEVVYAILLGTPRPGELRIRGIASRVETAGARIIGHGNVSARADGGDLVVAWPPGIPAAPAHGIALPSGASR
jgi:alpha-L-fucosidase